MAGVGDEQILRGTTSVYRRIVFVQRCHSALRRVLSKGVFVDIKDFLRMFAYDYWANRECLAAMRAAEPVPEAAVLNSQLQILSSERSEGSASCGELQIPHFVRDDNS